MKFKFAFKVHSDILTNGTRYVIEMPGLVKVKADQNTLSFLFEYEENPVWKYLPTSALITGWNDVSLDGNNSIITLTVNNHNFIIVDSSLYPTAITFTNFATNNYVVIDNTSTIGTADTWEQQWHLVTDANASSTSNNSQYINSGNTAAYCDFGIQNGYWNLFLSSNGSSWNIVNGVGRNVRVQNSTEYLVNLSFTGTQYIFKGSTDLGQNWTTFDTYNSTTKVYPVSSTRLGNSYDAMWPWKNTIYVDQYSYIKTNGNFIFKGDTSILTKDYFNHGCTYTPSVDYAVYPTISTGELKTFQSWLYLKDIVARKITD